VKLPDDEHYHVYLTMCPCNYLYTLHAATLCRIGTKDREDTSYFRCNNKLCNPYFLTSGVKNKVGNSYQNGIIKHLIKDRHD